jgi:hypothetical protein
MDFGAMPGIFQAEMAHVKALGNPATVPLHNCFFGLRFMGF